jgi:uncharacterized protein (TIGR03546 family)
MLILKYLAKIVKILRSAASPNQIAGGFILGMVFGLTPLWSLHNLLIFIIVVILNVNISMVMFSFIICSGFAYIFDPLFHDLGYYLLVDVTSLNGLWTSMMNIPIIAFSKFNNTVVMGSFVSAIALMLPVFFLVKYGVIAYREKIDARIQKLKIVQALKGSKLYGFYEKIRDWRD